MLNKHFLSKMFEDRIEFKNRTDKKHKIKKDEMIVS